MEVTKWLDRPWRRSFLSFTLRNEPELRRCIAAKAVARFKHRVRELTGRHRGDPRAGSIPSGMGRLLRLQPVAGAAVARRLGPTTPALRRLGPVEDARQAIPGTAPPKRPRTADERSYLQPQGSLADQLLRSPAQGLHQSSLPSSGFANEPPYTDPYVRWCGRGGAARLPPIPIDGREHDGMLDRVGAAISLCNKQTIERRPRKTIKKRTHAHTNKRRNTWSLEPNP
jgi:hypothetical protein